MCLHNPKCFSVQTQRKPQLLLEVMLHFLLVTCRCDFTGKEPESEEGSWQIGLNMSESLNHYLVHEQLYLSQGRYIFSSNDGCLMVCSPPAK